MHRDDMLKTQKILVVDGSRVVRASLARCVSKSHGVCEAHDGESAWHSLVLDASIVAVIAGAAVVNQDGSSLLERVRTNRLPRISHLPFYMLVSDTLPESERQRAQQQGVTAFIPKKAPAATLAELLGPCQAPLGSETEVGRDSSVGLDDFGARMERLTGLGVAPSAPAMPAAADEGGAPAKGKRQKHCLENDLRQVAASQPAASVLIFGIDGYASLCECFGRRMADKVVDKFSRLLRSKIRAQESLLPLAEGRVGIALGGIDRQQCTTFARRVCKALAAATLSVGGERIKATVSAGVAATPEDGNGLSAEELFYLASNRLESAVAAGGNRVVEVSGGGRNLRQGEFIARLASLLTASSPQAEMPCKSWLNSICIACHEARPKGQPTPCGASSSSSKGACDNQQAADR